MSDEEREIDSLRRWLREVTNERNALKARVAELEEGIRANVAKFGSPYGTHYIGCHHDHAICAFAALLAPAAEPRKDGAK